MKKYLFLTLLTSCLLATIAKGQETENVKEKINGITDVLTGMEERLATAESSISKLSKIKVSGYVQTQYQYFENPAIQPTHYFSIRRARLKFTYEMTDGVKFVLQPELLPGAITLKEAYMVLNDRWTKSFSLAAGKINRLNYEVEYSSSQLEVLERSLVIRTLYPGEYALGAKLEYRPLELPLVIQTAVLNGSDGLTIHNSAGANINSNENKDFDNYKDFMARATYSLQLGNLGGLDFGMHGYYGFLKSNAVKTLSSDYTTLTDINVGDAISRNWVGAEFQFFADVLGGMSIKGEYLMGKNASVGYAPVAAGADPVKNPAVAGVANFQNNFSGYYLYLIKNLGKSNQLAFRHDYYDPNTNIKGADVRVVNFKSTDETTLASRKSGKSDLATSTYSIALHHYFDDNVRISLNYDIVQNEKVGSADLLTEDYTKADGTKVVKGIDYSNRINQNVLTLRLQAKF